MTPDLIYKIEEKNDRFPILSTIYLATNFHQEYVSFAFYRFLCSVATFVLIQLLPAWFTSMSLDIKTIAAFTLTSLPYTWKFLCRLIRSLFSSAFRRRRSWIFLSQIKLFDFKSATAFLIPRYWHHHTFSIVLAFLSATQDGSDWCISPELLSDNELGLGNSI